MEEGTRSFAYEGGEYVVRYKHKNRHREAFRRIYRLLVDNGKEAASAHEFAAIVAFSVDTPADAWKPPRPDASADDLLAAYAVWLDEGDADLTDLWTTHAWNPPPPVTGPNPLPADADPNASSSAAPGKKAS